MIYLFKIKDYDIPQKKKKELRIKRKERNLLNNYVSK